MTPPRRTTVYLPGRIYELAVELDLNLSQLVREGVLAAARERGVDRDTH